MNRASDTVVAQEEEGMLTEGFCTSTDLILQDEYHLFITFANLNVDIQLHSEEIEHVRQHNKDGQQVSLVSSLIVCTVLAITYDFSSIRGTTSQSCLNPGG